MEKGHTVKSKLTTKWDILVRRCEEEAQEQK